jgi:hypothetical protein
MAAATTGVGVGSAGVAVGGTGVVVGVGGSLVGVAVAGSGVGSSVGVSVGSGVASAGGSPTTPTTGAGGTGVAVGGMGVAVGGSVVLVGGTAVGVAWIGVAVGGTGVSVAGTGVLVGGTGVAVGATGVSVGGTGVYVAGTGVSVAGTGVSVGGTSVGVAVGGFGFVVAVGVGGSGVQVGVGGSGVGVLVGFGLGVAVEVGGTGVLVGVLVARGGTPPAGPSPPLDGGVGVGVGAQLRRTQGFCWAGPWFVAAGGSAGFVFGLPTACTSVGVVAASAIPAGKINSPTRASATVIRHRRTAPVVVRSWLRDVPSMLCPPCRGCPGPANLASLLSVRATARMACHGGIPGPVSYTTVGKLVRAGDRSDQWAC